MKQKEEIPKDFIPTLQLMVAITAVGPSALRGQGKGVLDVSQKFLAQISLAGIPKKTRKLFATGLIGKLIHFLIYYQ